MTRTPRLGAGLALAVALLFASALAGEDRVLFEKPLAKTLCPGAPLTVDAGFDSYVWYQGPDLNEITLDEDGAPLAAGVPLKALATTEAPKLPAKKFKGHKVLYLRRILARGGRTASKYTKIAITHAETPEPTIESASEVDRGEPVELKTKEDFKQYEWQYLGIPVRAKAAIEGRANDPARPDRWRCVKIKDGGIAECDAGVWTGATPVTDDMRFLRAKLRRKPLHENLLDGKTAVHHPLINRALYGVEVKDSNGCKGARLHVVAVDQITLDLIAGIDFARSTGLNPDLSANGQMPDPMPQEPAMMDDSMQDPAQAEPSGGLFSNSAGFAGVRWRQYVRDFWAVYGDTRFGGTNIQPKGASTPDKVLLQADTFQADFGMFYDIACGQGAQICFYAKGELGVILPENEVVVMPDGTSEEKRVDDQLLRSFFGVGWRYHKPDSIFHRTYTEVGIGQSDNFADSGGRIKLRAEAFFDLTNTWDIFLRGELDNDLDEGADDLRVVFGASRDLAFLGEVLVNVLGLGEKKSDKKK